jgi:3-oxoadipate enol-lactonase
VFARRATFFKTDPQVFRAACDALASLDLRPELAQVKVPMLVLVGEHDEATPPPDVIGDFLPAASMPII